MELSKLSFYFGRLVLARSLTVVEVRCVLVLLVLKLLLLPKLALLQVLLLAGGLGNWLQLLHLQGVDLKQAARGGLERDKLLR